MPEGNHLADILPVGEEAFPTLKEAETLLIRKALELAKGNQGVAARYLGITRQGLNKILNREKQRENTADCGGNG